MAIPGHGYYCGLSDFAVSLCNILCKPSRLEGKSRLYQEDSSMTEVLSPGARFRAAVLKEKPLQVAGAINAYSARLAERVGFKALYV